MNDALYDLPVVSYRAPGLHITLVTTHTVSVKEISTYLNTFSIWSQNHIIQYTASTNKCNTTIQMNITKPKFVSSGIEFYNVVRLTIKTETTNTQSKQFDLVSLYVYTCQWRSNKYSNSLKQRQQSKSVR